MTACVSHDLRQRSLPLLGGQFKNGSYLETSRDPGKWWVYSAFSKLSTGGAAQKTKVYGQFFVEGNRPRLAGPC